MCETQLLFFLGSPSRHKFVNRGNRATRFHMRAREGVRQEKFQPAPAGRCRHSTAGPFHSFIDPTRSPSARVETDCIRRPAQQTGSGSAGPTRGSGSTGPSQVGRTENPGAIVRGRKVRSFVDVGKRAVSNQPPPPCDVSARTAATSIRWKVPFLRAASPP